MKILVLSDSHGDINKMERAIDIEKPQYIVFLGDRVSDFLKICDNYSGIKSLIVAGNCDGTVTGFSEKIVIDIEGKKFYITHGHNENVKNGYMKLIYSAITEDADVVLFGHTHIPCKNNYNGLELLNPGSVGSGSYGIITIDGCVETCIKNFF